MSWIFVITTETVIEELVTIHSKHAFHARKLQNIIKVGAHHNCKLIYLVKIHQWH